MGLSMIVWKINGENFIVADSNDPDLFESQRIFDLEVKERNELLHLEVKTGEDSVVVET